MRVPASPIPPAGAIRSVVEIAAPPEDVFRALTDPLELAAWLGDGAAEPSELAPQWAAPTAPIAGEPWRAPALGPDGTRGWVSGEYQLVQPPHHLETTWRASWDELTLDRVAFELVPIDVGGRIGTSLTVTHTRAAACLQVTASASAVAAPSGQWQAALARLAAHVTIHRSPFTIHPSPLNHSPSTIHHSPVPHRRPWYSSIGN